MSSFLSWVWLAFVMLIYRLVLGPAGFDYLFGVTVLVCGGLALSHAVRRDWTSALNQLDSALFVLALFLAFSYYAFAGEPIAAFLARRLTRLVTHAGPVSAFLLLIVMAVKASSLRTRLFEPKVMPNLPAD